MKRLCNNNNFIENAVHRSKVFKFNDEASNSNGIESDADASSTAFTPMVRSADELVADWSDIADNNIHYPCCWSEQQWLERKEKHKWLIASNGYLGCGDCSLVNSLGLDKAEGLSLRAEWILCKVTFNGWSKKQQLRSLRTKISAHQLSTAHKKAKLIVAKAQKLPTKSVPNKQQVVSLNETEKLFNIAYYLAKNHTSFAEYDNLIELQLKNGVLIKHLESHFNASAIVNHIAFEFKKKLTSKLVKENKKISIILENATVFHNNTYLLIIYIKIYLDLNEELIFLDLISVDSEDAEVIVSELLKCLKENGLKQGYLRKNLVCFACDGASSLLGISSGVGKLLRLKLKQPEIIIWNCLNHRLEQAVRDCMLEMKVVNRFQLFFESLHALCTQNCKNLKELKELSPALCFQIQEVGVMLDVGWISSSFQSVHSVWSDYSLLFQHFKQAAEDPHRTLNERKSYTALFHLMETVEFVKELSIMFDILKELSDLNFQLQEDFSTLARADKLLKRSVRVFGTMKNRSGEKERESVIYCENMKFQGVNLTHNSQIVNTDRVQLISNIIKNLECRCYATNGSKMTDEQMLKDCEVLNPETWPESLCQEVEKVVSYGEESIRNLCARFRLDDCQLILNAFRDFFDEGGRKIPAPLAFLTNVIKTVPYNTVECRRGLSAISSLLSNLESDYLLTDLSSHLFIKLNGPPLTAWTAAPFVKSWLVLNGTTDIDN